MMFWRLGPKTRPKIRLAGKLMQSVFDKISPEGSQAIKKRTAEYPPAMQTVLC
jgi:hypothetical protein